MIPWDQLISVLTTESNAADQALVQEWLQADPANQVLLDKLKKIWQAEYPDFDIYRNLDETKAWADFASRLPVNHLPENIKTITSHSEKRTYSIKPIGWMSIAASILLLITVVLWNRKDSKDEIVATRLNEQRAVKLPDGSKIKLGSNSLISISSNFNQEKRLISDLQGDVFFDIVHNTERPFLIEIGHITIADLGTSFSVYREADSIRIQVLSGKVAFTDRQSDLSTEITAGMVMQYHASRSGQPAKLYLDSLQTSSNRLSLDFDNLPLAEVIHRLQIAFGEKIIINDPTLLNLKLTAKLEGQTFEQTVVIICNSLGLQKTIQQGNYILSKR